MFCARILRFGGTYTQLEMASTSGSAGSSPLGIGGGAGLGITRSGTTAGITRCIAALVAGASAGIQILPVAERLMLNPG